MGRWIIVYESKFPCQGEMKCKCDKCNNIVHGEYRDLRCSDTIHYILPNCCDKCRDKKENTYIKASEE